jgi:hypothetical protein
MWTRSSVTSTRQPSARISSRRRCSTRTGSSLCRYLLLAVQFSAPVLMRRSKHRTLAIAWSSSTLSLIFESVVALCLFTHFFVRVRFFTSYGWSVLQSWIRHTSVIYYIASEDLWACGTFQPTVIAIVLLGRNAHFTLICGFICIEHIAEVHSSSNLEKLALHIRNHQIKTS